MIGREVVGGYDVARLAADDPQALSDWLDENGYTLPEGAEPILSEYVEEGWKFVAIRLAPDSDGFIKPLDVEFPTDEFVYPMKLSQLAEDPIDLTALHPRRRPAGDRRARRDLFRPGRWARSPAPPPELAASSPKASTSPASRRTRRRRASSPRTSRSSPPRLAERESTGAATEAADVTTDEDDLSDPSGDRDPLCRLVLVGSLVRSPPGTQPILVT